MARTVLVTGAAGFIGAALSLRLLERGERVVGIDNLNSYYDPQLKRARLARIGAADPSHAWRFEQLALEDGEALMALFAAEQPRVVVNLAAQAGAFVTRWRIQRPTSRAIWWVLATSLKGVAITAWKILCMPPAVRCMAVTATCLSMNASR